MPRYTAIGRLLITAALLATLIAPWLADWNESHVFSPQWSPHARFHGVTYLCMAFGSAILGLWTVWRKSADPDLGVTVGALIPVLYWGPFFIALLVPGTAVEDPGHHLKRLAGIPINVVAAAGQVLLSVIGLAMYRVARRENTPGANQPPR